MPIKVADRMHEITFLNVSFRDEETEIQRGHKEINRGNVDNNVNNKGGLVFNSRVIYKDNCC